MNRNTIIAFLLIIVCFRFFFSEFYYEKILRKPYPFKKREQVEERQIQDTAGVLREEKVASQETKEHKGAVEGRKTIAEAPVCRKLTDTTDASIDTVWIETDKIICGISEMGGKVVSIRTKEFTYSNNKEKDKKEFIELVPNESGGGAGLRINKEKFDNKIFEYNGDQKKLIIENDEKITLQFICNLKKDKNLIKQYTFYKGNYTIGYKVISDEIVGKNVEIGWECGIKESEKSKGRMAQFNRKVIHFRGGKNFEHQDCAKEVKIERDGNYNWVAISSKYFTIALIPEKVKDADIDVECYYKQRNKEDKKKGSELDLRVSFKRFCEGNEENYLMYAGPTKIDELKKLDIKLEKIIFGVSTKIGKVFATVFIGGRVWFPVLCEFVLWLLIKLQTGVKDYGVVIIIITIILRVVTYPLTQSSMKSMNKMKEMQPRINKIREKYKGNPKQMNQKIMDFYRNEGINPLGGMGGCLPMILQMPIMISLFIVLRKAIELRGQGTFLIPWIKDLSKAEVMFPLGFNIPLYGSNVALLPILMAVLMYFQNKATMKDPNQKAMVYFMPIMMLVLFNNFPSGLCLYFTFSTALQVIQQVIMDRKKKVASETNS